jgi:enoyl-CoA hydratase
MIEREDSGAGAVLLRIARPPVNALDINLIEALSSSVTEAVDGGAKAIVVTGGERAFSAGIDTKMAAVASEAEQAASVLAINALVSAIYSTPVPVLAAINGHAIGGGLVIALACDMRLASRGSYVLSLNEAEAGVPFPAGPLAVVQAALDQSVASDLCLSCRRLGPQEALALRVVDELTDAGDLERRALEQACKMASFGAYARVKEQLRAPVAERLRAIVTSRSDPMIEGWLSSPSAG